MKTPIMHHLTNSTRVTARRHVYSFLALIAVRIALLWTAPASAQLAGKGEIKGTVTDPSGAVVPGATIVATSTARGTKVTVKSSSSGDFSITALDPDIYTLSISAAGFSTVDQKDVHVNALEIANVPITLKLGAESETVTVSSAPPQLETSNATLGATMENDVYSALPIEMGAYGQPDQRRATDFAFIMPGVQSNNTNGNATTNAGIVNGSGSRGAVSAIYIDGIPFVHGAAGGNDDPRFRFGPQSPSTQSTSFRSRPTDILQSTKVRVFRTTPSKPVAPGFTALFTNSSAIPRSIPGDSLGPSNKDPITGKPVKPTESNTQQRIHGINLSGPLVPIGG